MNREKMKCALIMVDVQNDFCPGGSLAVKEGDQVVKALNRLKKYADVVVATRDWHPEKTAHFQEGGGIWPPHCVRGTKGAEFHPDLDMSGVTVFSKGMDPEDDGGYSGFDGVNEKGVMLGDYLRAHGVECVIVGGLATDYCVKATVLDALAQGFRVKVIKNAVRAVNLKPGDGKKAWGEMIAAGACMLIASHKVVTDF